MTGPASSEVSLGWAGPGQSDLLVHFCRRHLGSALNSRVPEEISTLKPWERLDKILAANRLRGFPPFGAEDDQPVVCFSESPPEHLEHLLRDRGWQPWGVVVTRRWVYQQGGGPVWYARTELYDARTREQKPWLVRFDASPDRWTDWTHEREWRIPVGQLDLEPGAVVAILIGDECWTPSDVARRVPNGQYRNGCTDEPSDSWDPYATEDYDTLTGPPAVWETAERWYWDPDRASLRREPPSSCGSG